MPRKKEFDVDAVLNKAMEAFWARGYEATSLNDLLDCMQIQRASLYNAFGDKRTLFLETLRRYDVIYRRAEVAKRVNMPSPRQAILGLFQDAVTAVVEHGARNGCFLINTALELSPHDEEVAGDRPRGLHPHGTQIFPQDDRKGPSQGRDCPVSGAGHDRACLAGPAHRVGCPLPQPSGEAFAAVDRETGGSPFTPWRYGSPSSRHLRRIPQPMADT